MGKYTGNIEFSKNELRNISNELAEANRLKRLELLHQQFKSLLNKEELEDKA